LRGVNEKLNEQRYAKALNLPVMEQFLAKHRMILALLASYGLDPSEVLRSRAADEAPFDVNSPLNALNAARKLDSSEKPSIRISLKRSIRF